MKKFFTFIPVFILFFPLAAHADISFVGSNSAEATTVTIPAHQAGDLIIMFAYRDGSATVPTQPAGWVTIQGGAGANTNAARMGWQIATSSSTSSGTWTSATELIVLIYRGINKTTPVGGSAETGNTGSTVTYPAVTMVDASGNSWVVGAAGHRSINTTIETPPSGMINRVDQAGATAEAAAHDTNGGVTGWSGTNVSVGGTSSGWRSITVELLVDPPPRGIRIFEGFVLKLISGTIKLFGR